MNRPVLIVGPGLNRNGIGGVTIHVQRLMDFLSLNNFQYRFVDYKETQLFPLLFCINKFQIIHFHVSNPIYLFLLVLYAKIIQKYVVFTLHGNYGRFGWTKNLLTTLTVRLANIPIVINKQSFERCKVINKNTQFIPAFIPPQKEEQLQPEIIRLVTKWHQEGKRIVSTNASTVSFDKDGNEIYGIDFLVQYFNNDRNNILLVSDPSGNYKKRYLDLRCDSVFFIDYPHPYFELLKHVDCFVRNTATDGDAISVKEALYLGLHTMCSDVVDRPYGTKLFKYCDRDSFGICFQNASSVTNSIENGAEKVLQLYRNIK